MSFCTLLFLLALYIFAASLKYLQIMTYIEAGDNPVNDTYLVRATKNSPFIVILIVYALFGTLFSGVLLVYHLKIALKMRTTYEDIKKVWNLYAA